MTTEISVMYGSEKVNNLNCEGLMGDRMLTFSLPYMTEISVVIRQWT